MRRPAGRAYVALATLALVGLLGVALRWIPGRGITLEQRSHVDSVSNGARASEVAEGKAVRSELELRFEQATIMLHAKRYEYAITALDRVLELAPGMPEAHVNRGFALLGLGEPELAGHAFDRALELRPTQVNAYYGLAVSLDELGDRPGALGSMRAFVHLSPPTDPFLRKARAALWEWQASPSPGLGEGGRK